MRGWMTAVAVTVFALLMVLATEIAAIPEQIRGYGHVKEKHYAKAKARSDELLAAWRNPAAVRAAA